VQRLFAKTLPWASMSWLFVRHHLLRAEDAYVLAGDETVVTKAGKQSYGLDRFFASIYGKAVPGLAFFALSLLSVSERRSYPLMVEQRLRTAAEKQAARSQPKKQKRTTSGTGDKQGPKRRPGRPKGNKNQDKSQIEWTPELHLIQTMLQKLMALVGNACSVAYLVMDGHFGNNNALPMVRQATSLHLISKLRQDAALYFVYAGEQKRFGPRRRYGSKLTYQAIPEQYQVDSYQEEKIHTAIYQATLLHKSFAGPLNVVILVKVNLTTGARAHTVLFSSDLALSSAKLIDYYSLRFQLEIVFTQMTKGGDLTFRRGGDDVADFDLLIIDDDTVNQEFDELPALGKGQLVQGRLNAAAEVLDALGMERQIALLFGLCIELAELVLQALVSIGKFLPFALELLNRNDLRQIGIQQARLLSLQLCNGLLQGLTAGLKRLREPFPCLRTLQFMGNQGRVRQNLTEILPDQFVQWLGWGIAGRATFILGGAQAIAATATDIVGIARMHHPSHAGKLALGTTHQTA